MTAEPLVSAYDPGWPLEFERLRDRALSVVGDLAVAVEHVGSTAVPGLAAKPIIDLDVVVATADDVAPALDRLADVGYPSAGRSGVVSAVEGLAAPRWPPGEARHHLYVVVAGSRAHRERVAFRDHLRTHQDTARRYGQLKAQAARRCAGDWERYTRLKHELVQSILRTAMNESAAS
jgi:GrpB-like predicted nucleotidyltransferase (UPF0157 family)